MVPCCVRLNFFNDLNLYDISFMFYATRYTLIPWICWYLKKNTLKTKNHYLYIFASWIATVKTLSDVWKQPMILVIFTCRSRVNISNAMKFWISKSHNHCIRYMSMSGLQLYLLIYTYENEIYSSLYFKLFSQNFTRCALTKVCVYS